MERAKEDDFVNLCKNFEKYDPVKGEVTLIKMDEAFKQLVLNEMNLLNKQVKPKPTSPLQ